MSTEKIPSPPQVEAALGQLLAVIENVTKKPLDPTNTPWPEVEKAIVPLLGGPFQLQKPEHQVVALGLAGMWAGRLIREDNAFWFPNRDFLEGAGVGFTEALIMLSPMGAVIDALSRGNLARLDEVTREIRNSIAQAKFSATGGSPQRLSPVDYQRLFDPGLLQFVTLDDAKAAAALDSTPEKLSRDLRDAIGRAQQLPPEAKAQLEQQLVGGLRGLDQTKPLIQQAERAARLVELMAHLFAATGASGAAPEEFWTDVAFALLHIGTPPSFPPVDEEVKQAVGQGVDPLFLFLDVVPHTTPAPDEGPLGIFAMEEIGVIHPELAKVRNLRLLKVQGDRLKQLFDAFDAAKAKDAVNRFATYLEEQTGKKPTRSAEAEQLLDGAVQLLSDMKRLVAQGTLCLRRLTEAEALSEGALNLVRQALNAPRIIL